MWSTLTLRTMTPVFNSDGDPARAEIRVPSLRGGMRFWMRAMTGILAGDDLSALRAIEDRVLGSTGNASPIRLRVRAQPARTLDEDPDFLSWRGRAEPGRRWGHEQPGQWIGYLLGPGLVSWSKDKRRMVLNRAFVPAGEEFALSVRLVGDDEDAHRCALAALWLSLTYGGIGARTRRGFGSVRIVGVEGPAAGFGPPSPETPGLEHYASARSLWPSGPAAAAMPALLRIAGELGLKGAHVWKRTPDHPVLSKEHTLAGMHGDPAWTSWEEALTAAGRELRYFRAETEHRDQNKYRPPIKTFGWEEVVHGPGNELPMAAMGLPLVYDKKFEVHAVAGDEKLRRASPLWIRPVTDGRTWRLFSFGFLNRFLPEDRVEVHLWRDRRRDKVLKVTDADAHALVREWVAHLTAGGSFVRDV
ncbi:type III-B CRISPR module RAMP protein Cmr1 [Nocardiopsis lambiniae]|uniref:Type III-B CRISPR module RAMP protein Cmr1 n=1 Tax=Nocardiopsis lambiniae TaxID=3075539 RepID=A0ABU2M9K3_9ACTN|nr:type III-B CRISPR module RAMP protein Cmr1 [Nocardiopsis sp. DSM 44743]MDT0329342.1 type III-B CRISPR module RAMP protein Cmr1 [Nocardiopsis sp. DSM 44743]